MGRISRGAFSRTRRSVCRADPGVRQQKHFTVVERDTSVTPLFLSPRMEAFFMCIAVAALACALPDLSAATTRSADDGTCVAFSAACACVPALLHVRSRRGKSFTRCQTTVSLSFSTSAARLSASPRVRR